MATLKFPAGNVKAHRPGGTNPYNIPWTNASRWEPSFSEAAEESGVDPSLIVAMAILESDANQYRTLAETGTRDEVLLAHDHFDGHPSVGIMQVKPFYWQEILPDADAYTPQGNIRLGARLMALFIDETGSWENAIRLKYHPGVSPHGVTPQMYVNTIKALMAELEAANGTEPVDGDRDFRRRDKIRVADGPLRLRDGPSAGATILEELPTGAQLCVTGKPESADGVDWYPVRVLNTNKPGWVAGQFCGLVEAKGCKDSPVAAGPPTPAAGATAAGEEFAPHPATGMTAEAQAGMLAAGPRVEYDEQGAFVGVAFPPPAPTVGAAGAPTPPSNPFANG